MSEHAEGSDATTVIDWPRRWHEVADVVVIGAGFAGLAAAAAAASAGSAVVVLEKMARPGGNSAINLGDYAAWDDGRHRRVALGRGEDSADGHAADALAAGQHYGDPELVATMARGAPAALDWMIAEGGLRLHDALHRQHRGPFRLHLADSGRDYVEALRTIGAKHGVTLRTGARLARLWRRDAHGPVVGVSIETTAGRRDIGARQAVVLATGGFSADVAMRRSFRPVLSEAYNTTNHPGATGEAIRLAQAVGADALHLAFIEAHPFAHPETGALDAATLCALRLRRQGGIIVSCAGQRVVNEEAVHDMVSRAIVATGARPAYTVYTEAMLTQASALGNEAVAGMAEAIARGRIRHAASVAALGAELGMPDAALATTAARFAGFLAAGTDADFARPLTATMLPLADGPCYAVPHWPAVHFTSGGLRINPRAQVIDIWGAPIPRLYAAGEVTGGIHGMSRVGGDTTAAPIVFGRIAGTRAAAETRLAPESGGGR
ncbi:MAG TPA: flavocytochrome c [Candidatus Sulfotelmatobacter sp.]|nr:flavocytochrome c [Candidatus Sulfotelmatobacter sp.]